MNKSIEHFNISLKELDGPYLFYKNEGLEQINGQFDEGQFNSIKKFISKEDDVFISVPRLQAQFSCKVMNVHDTPPHHYQTHNSILAISDIEGDFEYFMATLRSQGVIDENLRWSFGNGHLVILGDIFDRGDLVTEVLWLMYKLDQEALQNGGRVHIILGNHEVMAMGGDDRYIHKKYRVVTEALGKEYEELFDKNTIIGKWLRTKNSIEIIGNTLFVHGGISLDLYESNFSIEKINELIRSAIDKVDKSRFSTAERLVMSSNGPLWYRGHVNQSLDLSELSKILNYYRVEHIIIGHSVVDKVKSLYNKAIYAIDVRRKKNDEYEALLIENGQFFRITSKGVKQPI
ncbi:MAG: metallophosphoesterase [Saprospiraceae bacterium]